MSASNYRRKRGFTLIELLIVMAIVALLMTIAFPRYWGVLDQSKEVVLQENLKVLRLTLDRFYADQGHYPNTLEELVENQYLREVPIDPLTESPRTWVLLPSNNPEIQGVADVKSGAPGQTRAGKAYGSL
jgi:general secretion pathway protein G